MNDRVGDETASLDFEQIQMNVEGKLFDEEIVLNDGEYDFEHKNLQR